MVFDDFFEHPFLKLQLTSTRPVPVPRCLASNASADSTPMQSPASYGSPVLTKNSPKQIPCQITPNSSSDEQVDDFVVVQPTTRGNVTGRYSRGVSPATRVSKSPSAVSPPEPMPVPSKNSREAYEMIQRSCGKSGSAGDVSNLNEARLGARHLTSPQIQEESGSSIGSEGSSQSRFVADVAQLSPPSVQFVIGASPPGLTASRSSANIRRRTSAPILNTHAFSGQTSPVSARQLTPPYGVLTPVKQSMSREHASSVRADLNFKWSAEQTNQFNSNKQLGFGTSPGNRPLTYTEGSHMPPYYNRPCYHQQYPPQHVSPGHHGCCCQTNNAIMPLSAPFASPPHNDEPMTFVAPELPEETLLDRDHNETLAKLNFVLALVDCIVEIASNRASPLSILTESNACKEVCFN